ncbi:helix-turn-helix domain-containing protein [Alkalihalobacillus sp. FSL W8-0930]
MKALSWSKESLPVYEALASEIRLSILQHVGEKPMNIKELADAHQVSSAIMTKHVKKLEAAHLLQTDMISGKAGKQKMCRLKVEKLEIIFPNMLNKQRPYVESTVSVGHYSDFHVEPTCGLATEQAIIGEFDDPRFFMDTERVNAKILWFYRGFVEYKLANFLDQSKKVEELEISLELSSEAPSTNENWPSDITFSLNGLEIGTWRSPGDFGERIGKFTPEWWPRTVNQYGLLKVIRIKQNGTYIDGRKISDVTISDVDIHRPFWLFRIGNQDCTTCVGGVTLFGSSFGNYNQDIDFRLYYRE